MAHVTCVFFFVAHHFPEAPFLCWGGGNNIGRVGTITHEEKHPGSVEMVHIKVRGGGAKTNLVTLGTYPLTMEQRPWKKIYLTY